MLEKLSFFKGGGEKREIELKKSYKLHWRVHFFEFLTEVGELERGKNIPVGEKD